VIEAMELNIQRKATEASLAAKAALLELNQLRGAAMNDTLSLGQLELGFLPLEKKQDELIKLAQANDFTVRERTLELKRQGFEVGLAENERLPAVTVGPSFSQEEAGERERVFGAAVSVPFPLWNLNQGNIATARARRTQAETSFYVAQREAERLTIEAFLTYDTKFKEMAKWQPDSIKHFKEASELADRHYRLGAVPVSIYVELQSQYLEATAGLYSTKIEALEAATQLELLTGARLSLTNENGEKRK
jgi:cobalt-zinc-cadmium efflux system outer membrane protein